MLLKWIEEWIKKPYLENGRVPEIRHGASHKAGACLPGLARGSGQGSCDRKSGDRAVSWAECSDPDRLDRSADAQDS